MLVSLANTQGAANFFGDNDSPEVVNAANNTGCFHKNPVLIQMSMLLQHKQQDGKHKHDAAEDGNGIQGAG